MNLKLNPRNLLTTYIFGFVLQIKNVELNIEESRYMLSSWCKLKANSAGDEMYLCFWQARSSLPNVVGAV